MQREYFGDLNLGRLRGNRFERSTNFRGRIGLHVERIELARCAEIEDHDGRALIAPDNATSGLGGEVIGQRKADRPKGTYFEEVAACPAIASVADAATKNI